MTRLSAVVVNWNGREYLEQCLPALLDQQPPPDEVILVDNRSEDDSCAYVAETFPQVRIVDSGGNVGPAAARNRGMQEAQHELCMLIDNDAYLTPGALAKMREALESDASCAVVQARSVIAGKQDVVHYDRADLHFLGTLVLDNWFRPLDQAQSGTSDAGAVIALCLLVRREIVLAAGGFDEDLFILFEDNDLSWNLRMRGHRLLHVSDAICHHAGGTAGLSFRTPKALYSSHRAFLHCRNRWLLLQRNARWRTLLFTAPTQWIYALVYTVFAASRGQLWAAMRGHGAALLAWPRSIRIRRDRQRARVVPDRVLLTARPMTANPGLADRGAKAALRKGLDRLFRAWWGVFKPFCG